MKRVLRIFRDVAASRALTPLVMGFFFFIYLGIAFRTDETLVTMMEFTRTSLFLKILLALIPLNSASRMAMEAGRYFSRRRALLRTANIARPDLFDETVTMPASDQLVELESAFGTLGYKIHRTERTLAAWRGVSVFPARMLFLIGTFCLFTGVLVSLTTRDSKRFALIEGEQLPVSAFEREKVARITLAKTSGLFLDRTLTMEVAPSMPDAGKKVFGLYPPTLYGGYFVYPRYLGIAPLIRFSAPDFPKGNEAFGVLNIYPAGKEDSVDIPGTSYRIVVSIAEPEGRDEAFMTGRMTFLFKLLKGKGVIFTGSAPLGGEFVRDGYHLAFPDYRRMVFTDFIRDYGVLLVWAAALLFIAAGLFWLPVRLFFPRREMLFLHEEDTVQAYSRAEGGRRRHAGVFQKVLDLLEARRSTIE